MKTKSLLWIVAFLILCSSASALLSDHIQYWFSFETNGTAINDATALSLGDLDLATGNNDIQTERMTGAYSIHLANKSGYYEDNYLKLPTGASSSFTRTGWVYVNDTITEDRLPLWGMGTPWAGGYYQAYANYDLSDNQIEMNIALFGSTQCIIKYSPTFTVGNWMFIAQNFNKTHHMMYINGSLVNITACSVTGNFNNRACIGQFECTSATGGGQKYFFDDFAFWNRSLSQAEIDTLYNSHLGYNPYRHTFDLTAYDNLNGTALNTFNATINGTFYNTTTGTIQTIFSDGIVNITINAANYQTKTYTNYNLSSDLDAPMEYYVPRFVFNQRARAISGNTTITNFSLSFYNLNTSSVETIVNTTNGNVTAYLTWNNTYNVTIDPAGYQIRNITHFANQSLNYSIDIYFYTTNSIFFNFLDEDTDAQVYNVSFELISDIYSNNYTTTPNSTKYLDLLSPATYLIRYSATGYEEKMYYFTLSNRTYTNLTLYLSTAVTNVTAIVYDESNNELEDAYIEVLRYDITTNSYVTTEIAKTNFEGTTMLHLVLNTEFYKFIIEYPYGTTKKVTTPSYIYETTLNFQIILGEETAEDFYDFMGIDVNLTFNNATNNFRFTYNDAENVLSQACLKVWEVGALKENLLNTTCIMTSSGTILIGVTPTNGTTYKASAYIYLDGTEYHVGSAMHTFPAARLSGNLGMFLIIFLMIVFLMIGYWNIIVAGILFPLPLAFGSLLHIIPLGLEICIPIEVLSIFLSFVVSRYA